VVPSIGHGGPRPAKAEDRRIAIINAKKQAIIEFEPKSGSAWDALLALLTLDSKDARPAIQEHAFRALGGAPTAGFNGECT